jgi:hypothetical protein
MLHGAARRALEGFAKVRWGFAPAVMPFIVEQLGPLQAVGWFVTNMPRYERTLSLLGPIKTHLLAAEISILAGCRYCTHGHARAFGLHHFRTYGRLFLLDEVDFVALHRAEPETVAKRLDEALGQSGLDDEARVLERMRVLRQGEPATTDTDERIAHLLQMFATLNTCAVSAAVEPDEAHDPIHKDVALRDRYDAARQERLLRA